MTAADHRVKTLPLQPWEPVARLKPQSLHVFADTFKLFSQQVLSFRLNQKHFHCHITLNQPPEKTRHSKHPPLKREKKEKHSSSCGVSQGFESCNILKGFSPRGNKSVFFNMSVLNAVAQNEEKQMLTWPVETDLAARGRYLCVSLPRALKFRFYAALGPVKQTIGE